jgi:hypothetical protein
MNLVSLWRNRAGQTLAVAFSAIMAIGFVLHGVSAFAADDESGPADGCAPSLVSEGFLSRYADT